MSRARVLQYQKPMAIMLAALVLPTVMGVYNFGWRVLATVLVANLTCLIGEFLFVRKQGKPVTLAAMVTATLFALVLPPNVPFWMVVLGAGFAIVFGKMVFGGFGKNVFNPAMVGRCLLYVAFPLALSGTWFGPAPGPGGGLTRWTVGPGPDVAPPDLAREVGLRVPERLSVDGVTSATVLIAAKKLNRAAKAAGSGADAPGAARDAAARAVRSISFWDLFFGRISGSQGEGSAFFILLGFGLLLYRKSLKWQLAAGPALGLIGMTALLHATGAIALPLASALKINLFAGGTLFAIVFMTTEPVSAPTHKGAIWGYGVLIGALGTIIRALGVFNAGLMFAILIANMFAPLLDVAGRSFDAWRKGEAPS